MYELPPLPGKPTYDVWVKNWPKPPSLAGEYFQVLRRRYLELQNQAKENEIAVLRYYTPAGDEIRITSVTGAKEEETILLEGVDGDGNTCVVVVLPQNAQIFLKLIELEESDPGQSDSESKPVAESKPVEFIYSRP